MANLTRTTRDHEEIRRWAEERGGKPSHVKRTGSSEDIGILRIDFPGYTGEDTLEPISWEQWFEKFDDRRLALIYQEETAGGARSNFNKIVGAETAQEAEQKSHVRGGDGAGRSRSRGSRAKKAIKSASTATRRTIKKSVAASGAAKKGTKTATKRSGRKAVAKKSSGRSAGAKKSASKRATKTAAKKGAAKRRR